MSEPPWRHDRPVNVPPVPPNLAKAADWSWRLLAVGAALFAVIALLWYLQVIVLPIMVALTVAPALTPIAERLRSLRLERPAAAIALLAGLALVAGLSRS
ncbi:MAG: hypothetical protein ACRDMK_07545 [Gaiellaceae bacterium]